MFLKYTKDLQKEFKDYNGAALAKDLMAGLTVAAVALPLALAFGVSSGASAASGLVTAIIGGIIISLFGGAFYQISGPTGAMAAILMSVVAQYGMQGVFVATLMAGILLVLAGVFRLGRLVSFIPMPVITGFTSGIAVIIALGQVDNFFGVTSQGSSAVEKLLSYGHLGFSPNLTAMLIGIGVVLFMIFFPKKWNAVVPASLLSIILATAVSIFFHLDVQTVGEIPKTLLLEERLSLGGLGLEQIYSLLVPAVSIAALGMIESLLCGASAGRMTNEPLDNDRELVAQGIGNILVPLFGGIPATAAIARTSVAIKSGAKTRVSGIFHGVGLLISMFLLGPIMSQIPLSALAGVLMVTAWRMNEWETIGYIFSHKFKGAIAKFLITMLATILFDLTVAILIGVLVALVLLAVRFSKMEINYESIKPERIHNKDGILPSRKDAVVAYLTGPIIFTNTEDIASMEEKLKDAPVVLFSMRGVPEIDISGAQALLKLFNLLKERGTEIFLCGVSTSAMETIHRSGIYELLGENCFYWSVERALLDEEPKPISLK